MTTTHDTEMSEFRRTDIHLRRTLSLGGRTFTSCVDTGRNTDDPLGDWWHAFYAGNRPTPDENRGKIRFVELFCGSGGLAVGFSQACRELGFDPHAIAAVDHDPEAVAVYQANHQPEFAEACSVSRLVDYRVKGQGHGSRFRYAPEMLEPRWAEIAGSVDVLLAGPPCQGHSSLNNHTCRADPRNDLYLSVPAAAVALNTRTVIIENVPGVVHDRLGVVATTTHLLEAAGYRVESGVLKAEQLGWAQRRNRFFLVASRQADPIPLAEVAGALDSPPRPLMWAIGDLENAPQDDSMFRQPELTAENRRRIDWLFDNAEHDLPFSERPECHQDGTTYTSVYGRMFGDRPSQTITTGFMTPGRGRYIHPTRRRVLTPREAARLQGFPDTYEFEAERGVVPPFSKLGKWIGDAVPMPLGFAAGLATLVGTAR